MGFKLLRKYEQGAMGGLENDKFADGEAVRDFRISLPLYVP
jgi:hypothetical protein